MCSTRPAMSAARSAVAFIGTTWPLRGEPSAVISTFVRASASRAATASGPNPLKIGTQIAPSFEQAMIAATASGIIGRKIPTVSRGSTPSERSPRASRSVSSRRSAYVQVRTEPSSPSPSTAGASGVLEAHRSTHWCARFSTPPVNQVVHSTPERVSKTSA